MNSFNERSRPVIFLAWTAALAGCTSYFKQDQNDSAIAELRSDDQNLQTQIDVLSQKFDTLAKEVANRIRIDIGTGLATDDATLGEEAKTFLQEFARALSSRSDASVTVEGFAGPQGRTAYNRRGERRPQAVADGLATCGMSPTQLRTVRRRTAKNRQVRPGHIAKKAGTTAVSHWRSTSGHHDHASAGAPGDPRAGTCGRGSRRSANGRHVSSRR